MHSYLIRLWNVFMPCRTSIKGPNVCPQTYNPMKASPKYSLRQSRHHTHSISACYKCITFKLHKSPPLAPKHSLIPPPNSTNHHRPQLQRRATQQQDDSPPPPPTKNNQQQDDNLSPAVKAAISFLKGYKAVISPLIPPSCRYLPTCSEYGMDAYRKFGLGKGTVLTAWRLMRCNPFGGNGYDPVKWPPPGLEMAFKWWE